MKLVAEYRRRALAVNVLADGALCEEEARALRKIARAWEAVARIREEYLKNHPDSSGLRR